MYSMYYAVCSLVALIDNSCINGQPHLRPISLPTQYRTGCAHKSQDSEGKIMRRMNGSAAQKPSHSTLPSKTCIQTHVGRGRQTHAALAKCKNWRKYAPGSGGLVPHEALRRDALFKVKTRPETDRRGKSFRGRGKELESNNCFCCLLMLLMLSDMAPIVLPPDS